MSYLCCGGVGFKHNISLIVISARIANNIAEYLLKLVERLRCACGFRVPFGVITRLVKRFKYEMLVIILKPLANLLPNTTIFGVIIGTVIKIKPTYIKIIFGRIVMSVDNDIHIFCNYPVDNFLNSVKIILINGVVIAVVNKRCPCNRESDEVKAAVGKQLNVVARNAAAEASRLRGGICAVCLVSARFKLAADIYARMERIDKLHCGSAELTYDNIYLYIAVKGIAPVFCNIADSYLFKRRAALECLMTELQNSVYIKAVKRRAAVERRIAYIFALIGESYICNFAV